MVLIEPTAATFTVAESIQQHIKTLDAVHLATALTLGEPVTIVTHDINMTRVAHELVYQP